MTDKPEIFMAPGPTPVPPEVLLAQGSPLVYHRGPGYGALLREVTEDLQEMMKTTSDVLCFTSSGTGGLESAVANLCSPGDRVVVPVAGYFGDRFAKIATRVRADVRRIDYEWGSAVRADDVAAALDEAPTTAVLDAAQRDVDRRDPRHRGASARPVREAGALSRRRRDLEPGRRAVRRRRVGRRRRGRRFAEGAVGRAGHGVRLRVAAGMGGVDDARRARGSTSTGRLYKDSYDQKDPENPFTPAISTMQGLRAALRLYFDEGQEAVLARHQLLSEATKAGVRAIGLELSGEYLERAWAVTAVKAPDGIDGDELVAKVPRRPPHRPRARAGPDEGQGVPHRAPGLLRPPRHHPRAWPRWSRRSTSMGYPAQPGAAVAAAESGLRAGIRTAGLSATMAERPAGPGDRAALRDRPGPAARASFDVDVRPELAAEGLAEAIEPLRRADRPLADQGHRRRARARPTTCGSSPGPASAWTTSTSTPPPAAASWS